MIFKETMGEVAALVIFLAVMWSDQVKKAYEGPGKQNSVLGEVHNSISIISLYPGDRDRGYGPKTYTHLFQLSSLSMDLMD